MPHREPAHAGRRNGILAILAASALWGASGGVVAGIDANGAAAACLVVLVAGATLLVAGTLSGASVQATVSSLSWSLFLLALLEASNTALYYLALHLAPLGVVIALHLTSPLMLAIAEILHGRRSARPRDLISVVAVAAAIILIGLTEQSGGGSSVVLGLALSVASAACLALVIVIVRRFSSQTSSLVGSGLQMLCSGLLLAPSLVLLRGHGGAVLPLAVTAVGLFAPAAWYYWRALRHLEPIPAATIGLTEPIFGALAALVIFRISPSILDAFAVLLILAAAWLELTRQPGTAGLGAAQAGEPAATTIHASGTLDSVPRRFPNG